MSNIEEIVNNEINKIKKSYFDSVDRIISDYQTSQAFTTDYKGRQLYELIQNAEDQATEEQGQIKIELNANVLRISNTGKPFSSKGVKSILYVCNSSKFHGGGTIGYKGIGFRSLLNWTNEIKIISNDFTLSFSEKIANGWLNDILAKHPEYEDELKNIAPCPIAVLSCPDTANKLSPEKGFTTTIELTVNTDIADSIKEQINSLEPEVLLFLRKTRKIELIENGRIKIFEKNKKNNLITLSETKDGTTTNTVWTLYSTPAGSKTEKTDKEYEITIAYDKANKKAANVLYTYFKTDVKISFPAFIHATFELTSNRNELVKDDEYNRELVELLAKFLASTAVEIAKEKENGIATYDPLKLLLTNEIDTSLEAYKFNGKVYEELKTAKVFPTINDEYISLTDGPKFSALIKDNCTYAKLLDKNTFSTLLKDSQNEKVISDYITGIANLKFYDKADFQEKLNSAIDSDTNHQVYTIEKKSYLIRLINSDSQVSGEGYKLLSDEDENPIPLGIQTFARPKEKANFIEPNFPWLKLRFLNRKMQNILLQDVSQDVQETTYKSFSLFRYRFVNLVRNVVRDLNDNLTENNVILVLRWLYTFYTTPSKNDEETEERELGEVKVPVISRDNKFVKATECYFGKEYGNESLENIISIYTDNFLKYDLELFGDDDKNKVITFYEWLKVSWFPREESKKLTINSEESRKYINFCFTKRQYFVSEGYYSRSDLYDYGFRLIQVSTIENYKKIIEEGNIDDLIIYFLKDSKIRELISSEHELNPESKITYAHGNMYLRTFNKEQMAPYFLYQLKNTPWLLTEKGKKDVSHCCLEKLSVDDVIFMPKINYDYIKSKCNTSDSEINGLLVKLGVAETFSDIPTDIKYELFMELPRLDSEHVIGKSIYNKMKGTASRVLLEKGSNYTNFIKNGSVLVKYQGSYDYKPIKEARYLYAKVFSDKILANYKIFCFDTKEGRVDDLFGIKNLELTDSHISAKYQINDEKINTNFSAALQEYKPYILACRLLSSEKTNDASKLNNTQIILGNNIHVTYYVNDVKHEDDLNDFDTVYLGLGNENEETDQKKKIAYVKIPDYCNDFSTLRFDSHFADAIADIITIILNVYKEKQFFSQIFEATSERRDELLSDYKGGAAKETIKKARELLNKDFDPCLDFWLAITECKKKTFEEDYTASQIADYWGIDKEYFNKLNYDNINEEKNFELIIVLFGKLKIDIEDFNSYSAINLNIQKYWKNKFDVRKRELRSLYNVYLYNKYKESKDIKNYELKRTGFLSTQPIIQNSISVDVDKLFEESFSVTISELNSFKPNDLEEIIAGKKQNNKFYESLKDKLPEEKLNLYLLFDSLDKLEERQTENQTPKFKPKSQQEINEEAKKLAEGAEYEEGIQTEKVDVSESHSHVKTQNGHNSFDRNYQTEDEIKQINGRAAELAVYDNLCKKYGKTNVDWLSKNAEYFGVTEVGNDNLGYDITYTNSNNQQINVEVKSVQDKIEFNLSRNELDTGMQNPNNYEIIVYSLPQKKVKNLGKIFKFEKPDETPFNNSKFTIHYDTYLVSAKEVGKENDN